MPISFACRENFLENATSIVFLNYNVETLSATETARKRVQYPWGIFYDMFVSNEIVELLH